MLNALEIYTLLQRQLIYSMLFDTYGKRFFFLYLVKIDVYIMNIFQAQTSISFCFII